MPHLVRQQDIPLTLRSKNLARYRTQLRAALANPALTAEQRQHIKQRLATVGLPKVYRADSPPPPGAIDPNTGLQPEPVLLSGSALNRLTKTDVFSLGRNEGAPLSLSMTKTKMIEAILAHR